MVPQVTQDKEALFFNSAIPEFPGFSPVCVHFPFKTGSFLNASLSLMNRIYNIHAADDS